MQHFPSCHFEHQITKNWLLWGIPKVANACGVMVEEQGYFVEMSAEPLDLLKYTSLVEDDGAGAIATFLGVTRDNFNGKRVLKLTYEAYGPMAEKEMKVRGQVCVHS